MVNIKQHQRFKQVKDTGEIILLSNDDIQRAILESGKFDSKKIAEQVKVTNGTPYKWLHRDNVYPAYGIAPYVKTTGDTSPLDLINQACGFIAVPAVDFREIDRALTRLEIEINLAQARYIEEIEKSRSLESAKGVDIDRFEARRIQAKGLDAIRIIRASMLAVKEMVK